MRAFIAFCPRCFRCMLEILSRPVAFDFFRDLIAFAVPSLVKGGGQRGIYFGFVDLSIYNAVLWVGGLV